MTKHYPEHSRKRRPRPNPIRQQRRNEESGSWWPILLLAAVIGAGAGILSNPTGASAWLAKARPVAVSVGLTRVREPQSGDYWAGCNDARAAGTAPIYAGEPGYRSDMDGDSDGIACESHG
ncbi:excalibur calcium-binding domain-containing protein [Novosphingobium umbonatum]|uniref:Excalibur calcium-binding domain-containing protein n=1 Tax=Novosphingobium umbonatum TaxID=1908524 RepID=A0A3S2Y5L0_9SPHN|nr:excalibur calcium-binding domain-containing protein [Novosphingobium umbonatum]RVU04040.1 excalibur calcium-binding domain-containing protein [Novosphingobium umbonatum]